MKKLAAILGTIALSLSLGAPLFASPAPASPQGSHVTHRRHRAHHRHHRAHARAAVR
jgi:hypothetical protein